MKIKLGLPVIIATIAIVLFTVSCKDEPDNTDYQQELIEKFLQERNLVSELMPSGLHYIEVTEGTGDAAYFLDTLQVYYKGMYLDGRIFDVNIWDDEPFAFTLGIGSVIDGWDEGMGYMRVGGEAMLVIPSYLGYGSSGSNSIPGNTPLLFEVQLVGLTPGPNHQ